MMPNISLRSHLQLEYRDILGDSPKLYDATDELRGKIAFEQLRPRDYCNMVFDTAYVSTMTLVYFYTNVVMILLSVTALIVSTVPDFNYVPSFLLGLYICDLLSTVFFTFDYIMRFILTRKVRILWVFELPNIIDFLSTIPFYISNLTSTNIARLLIMTRILRTFRLMRLLNLAQVGKEMSIYSAALRYKGTEIVFGMVVLVISVVVLATVIFYAEQTASRFDYELGVWIYENGIISGFQSIGASIYFLMTALASVGFGDIYPRTILGRAVTVLSIFLGVALFSFPSVILAISFNRKLAVAREKTKNMYKLQLLRVTSRGRGKFLTVEEILAMAWVKLIRFHKLVSAFKTKVEEVTYMFSEYEVLMLPFILKAQQNRRTHENNPFPKGHPRSLYDHWLQWKKKKITAESEEYAMSLNT